MNKLLIICGPTATGKTNLGLKLAKKFKGQIISADSRQVYKGMDIGTGKDLPQNLSQQKDGHYLINNIKVWGYDLVKPDQEFSLVHFINFAKPLISTIQSQNQLPILAGGTGLYLKAITANLATAHIPPNPKLRLSLAKLTVKELQVKLKKLNSTHFNQMNHSDQLNPRRLIRALEISKKSKRARYLRPDHFEDFKVNTLWLGLKANRKTLVAKITKRVDQRIKAGAQKEVETLIKSSYSFNLPAMSAMGYRQWQPFFNQEIDLNQVRLAWIQAEKQYLHRQLTWFKSNCQINWFDITTSDYHQRVVRKVTNWYTRRQYDTDQN